ncbi:hypothetical protein [Aliiglaciecola sp. LCG003]|uniref:hypothetical protein n=1 Tax=Aliiglaciecola sp. LCG003 TaxID=3053655 RepID=UPI0025744BC0|nr:hypothetical protein [Aliiglaciecola sp. LCG003]WJG11181.1 hypothetical protein QR722_09175 [Aliiglaciecola sp. LCG003]
MSLNKTDKSEKSIAESDISKEELAEGVSIIGEELRKQISGGLSEDIDHGQMESQMIKAN